MVFQKTTNILGFISVRRKLSLACWITLAWPYNVEVSINPIPQPVWNTWRTRWLTSELPLPLCNFIGPRAKVHRPLQQPFVSWLRLQHLSG